MQLFNDAWDVENLPSPSVVTVGNFDGLHLGQQMIIDRVVERAKAIGCASTVVTFDPHPLDILRPKRPPERITLRDQKRSLIERLGVDNLVVIGFSPDFATTTAKEFVEEFLVGKLGMKEIYVGSEFGFGKGREGDLGLLTDLSEKLGFRVDGVEELESELGTISSTRIRQAVRAGEMAQAARMLGRTFSVVGKVIHGEGRGKEHGWPTINVDVQHELMPADGVYASRLWLPAEDQLLEGVTNIGRRPTFPGGSDRVVEAHIFDFDRDVYGERVELGLVHRLRGERRFDSVEQLIRQIGEDARLAREYLGQEDCSVLVPTIFK